MKQIGSYIELELSQGNEYYTKMEFGNNLISLNSGRAAIYHAVKIYNKNTVYLPYYECDTVKAFLEKKSIKIKYYRINSKFEPILKTNSSNSAIVFVNYFGIMSKKHFKFIKNFKNIIIDNSQAFFFSPIKKCINIYSCRKFFGVPDGAYVIGKNVAFGNYEKDYSSKTSSFLLMRHENGFDWNSYYKKEENEKRINKSGIKTMSELTKSLLESVDYNTCIKKRKKNYNYARKLFNPLNNIDISELTCDESVPMIYPLLIDVDIFDELRKNGIYVCHFWEYLIKKSPKSTFEYKLSRFLIPVFIDQRYNLDDIKYQFNIIKKILTNKINNGY